MDILITEVFEMEEAVRKLVGKSDFTILNGQFVAFEEDMDGSVILLDPRPPDKYGRPVLKVTKRARK